MKSERERKRIVSVYINSINASLDFHEKHSLKESKVMLWNFMKNIINLWIQASNEKPTHFKEVRRLDNSRAVTF